MLDAPDQVYVHDAWMGWVRWPDHVNVGPAPSTRRDTNHAESYGPGQHTPGGRQRR